MRRLLAAAACHSQAWPWSEARRYAYAFVVGEIIMHSHMLACKLIFKGWLQLLIAPTYGSRKRLRSHIRHATANVKTLLLRFDNKISKATVAIRDR
jgi:hypothetical protein